MQIMIVIVAVLILGAGAIAAAGGLGGMPEEPGRDGTAPTLPKAGPVRGADLENARFAVRARGYDMEQVDALVARLALEIDVRDRAMAEAGVRYPAPEAEPELEDPKARAEVDDEDEVIEAVPVARPVTDPKERAAAWRGRTTTDKQDAGDEKADDPEAWRPREWRPRG